MAEKKPGWQILQDAATAIIEAPLGRLGDREKCELHHKLRLQTIARIDEIIPEDHADVIKSVITAGAALDDHLGREVTAFLKGQIEDLTELEQLVQETTSGEMIVDRCDCGCDTVIIGTAAFIERLHQMKKESGIDDLPRPLRDLLTKIVGLEL